MAMQRLAFYLMVATFAVVAYLYAQRESLFGRGDDAAAGGDTFDPEPAGPTPASAAPEASSHAAAAPTVTDPPAAKAEPLPDHPSGHDARFWSALHADVRELSLQVKALTARLSQQQSSVPTAVLRPWAS
jgi:hypothetical protein